jgi:MFS family permease
MATNNAYLSDVTPDGSRAASFGRLQGIMMFGFSLGPILGSAFIKLTGDM